MGEKREDDMSQEEYKAYLEKEFSKEIIITLNLRGIGNPHVIDYQDEEIRNKLENADEIVIEEEDITIHYSYPLNDLYGFSYNNRGGFSRMDLFRCIYEDYKKFYERKRKYGVYGHHLEELVIEEIKYAPAYKMVVLSIGS